MIKKIIIISISIVILFFSIFFVYSQEDCQYGEEIIVDNVASYCDLNKNIDTQKFDGEFCNNDF